MSLRARLERLGASRPANLVVPAAPPADGAPFLATRSFAATDTFGSVSLSPTVEMNALLELLEPAGATQSLLFLDTETTGLAGGTGTLPFLVGTGTFDGAT